MLFEMEYLQKCKVPRHTQTVICLCEYVEATEGLVPKDKMKELINDNEDGV